MTIDSMVTNFNVLALAYYYGAITYVIHLFVCHVVDSWNPSKDAVLQSSQQPLESFTSSLTSDITIRQLRTYIRVNKLHSLVSASAGKSVSNCSKHELILALA